MNLIENISTEEVFNIKTDTEFNAVALKIFRFQYKNCEIYADYCKLIKSNPESISHFSKIPFLPIQFFKSKEVICKNKPYKHVFKSSGTMLSGRSQHFVADLELYETSFLKGFELKYGNPADYTFLALLPSYLEQGDSSLVYMVDKLIAQSTDKRSGFYLNNYYDLAQQLKTLESEKKQAVLFGVSYALLDLIEAFPDLKTPSIIVIETGGMKGKRKELPKDKLHELLKKSLAVPSIHSEYGMTELLSQGYASKDGIFEFPNWIKPLIRQSNDPLNIEEKPNKTGGINIIDLANIWSCSFIATQDLGKISEFGLQIVGRFDHSDTRGCNLLLDL